MQVTVNQQPRPELELEPQQVMLLELVGRKALQKRHIASLIVNLYNSNRVGADMYNLMPYLRGEPNDDLRNGIFALLEISAYCESHEIYGVDFVRHLIDNWFSDDD